MPYDYVVDAIDTVTGKIDLVLQCRDRHIPIICSMGAGNKLDPTKFEVTDIYKTSVDPLARVMRKKLKENRVKKLKVVYSKEKPLRVRQSGCGKNCICPPGSARNCDMRRAVPGSISFVPSVVGLIIAGEVVRDLTGRKWRFRHEYFRTRLWPLGLLPCLVCRSHRPCGDALGAQGLPSSRCPGGTAQE